MSTGIKLTENQKEIITLMREGWALKRYIRYWFLSLGSDSKNVNGNSAFFLGRKGLIEGVEEAPQTIDYRLTELGKTIKL